VSESLFGQVPGAAERWTTTASAVLEDLLARHPEWASELGDHRFDDRLDDLTEAAERDERQALAAALDALDDLDDTQLAPQQQVDLAVLTSRVQAAQFALDNLAEAERDPLRALPGATLHAMLARPYAPLPDRLRALGRRLEQLPDRLADAAARLDPARVSVVAAETGALQAGGLCALLTTEVPQALAAEPGLAATVEPARAAALAAAERYRDALHALRQNAVGDPRLGASLWRAKLWHTLESELSATEIASRALDVQAETLAEMTEIAARLVGRGPAGDVDRELIREALDLVAAAAPTDATILAVAGGALDDAWRVTREADLLTLPDDPLELVEMPEFARGVAAAYCDPPGPLETAPLPTWYAIAPTPDDWSPARVASFYREYNAHALRNLAAHEAVPGHHVQLALARRYGGDTPVRAAFRSGPFVEGWAVYAERLAADAGLGGTAPVGAGTGNDALRLSNLKVLLRCVGNALLDQLVHCSDPARPLPELADDAMRMLTRDYFQEEGEAAGKWRRAQLTSTQLSTYFVGWSEVRALRADWDAAGCGTTKAFHDELLSHGSPAVRHLRGLLSL
jgi:uncharacterized protein (DUF885 family)